MTVLPSSLALTSIADGSNIVAADHRNNYTAVQTNVNALIALLGAGTLGQFLKGAGTTVSFDYPPGYQFAYQEFTGTKTATSSTEASAVSVVSAGAVTFDGSTTVRVEFSVPQIVTSDNSNGIVLTLFDGTTASPVGQLANVSATGGTFAFPGGSWSRELTPSAASHSYFVGILDAGAVTTTHAKVVAGAGGTGAMLPGFIRIVKA